MLAEATGTILLQVHRRRAAGTDSDAGAHGDGDAGAVDGGGTAEVGAGERGQLRQRGSLRKPEVVSVSEH